jgi:hypothetical protein
MKRVNVRTVGYDGAISESIGSYVLPNFVENRLVIAGEWAKSNGFVMPSRLVWDVGFGGCDSDALFIGGESIEWVSFDYEDGFPEEN